MAKDKREWFKFIKNKLERADARSYFSWKPTLFEVLHNHMELKKMVRYHKFRKYGYFTKEYEGRLLYLEAVRKKEKIDVSILVKEDNYTPAKVGSIYKYVILDDSPNKVISVYDAMDKCLYKWQNEYFKKEKPASK